SSPSISQSFRLTRRKRPSSATCAIPTAASSKLARMTSSAPSNLFGIASSLFAGGDRRSGSLPMDKTSTAYDSKMRQLGRDQVSVLDRGLEVISHPGDS